MFIILQLFFAVLKIGECHSDIPKFSLRHVRLRDAFRPIARERKYFMFIVVKTKEVCYLHVKLICQFAFCSFCTSGNNM